MWSETEMVLIRFTGEDSDINVKTKHPEFDSWQWVGVNELLENIIPFKYKLYSKNNCRI